MTAVERNKAAVASTLIASQKNNHRTRSNAVGLVTAFPHEVVCTVDADLSRVAVKK